MHVMGPPSAAGSAFNMIGIIHTSAQFVECPCSEYGGEAVFPGYCDLSHLQPERGGRHGCDGQDEATRWWFGQAGRNRPLHANPGLSATARAQVKGGEE
jgi:hypothetical protein